MSAPLIGLTGAPGAGRATIAAHLCDSRDFRSYSLTDPLRQVLYSLEPLLSSQVSLRTLIDESGWAPALAHRIHGPEVTRLLEALRTEVARDVFTVDLWVRRLDALVRSDVEVLGAAPVVVTDVATPEEAQWVLDAGGVIWQVDRPGHPASMQLHDRLVGAVIKNDATMLALTRRVDRALAGIPTLELDDHDNAAAA